MIHSRLVADWGMFSVLPVQQVILADDVKGIKHNLSIVFQSCFKMLCTKDNFTEEVLILFNTFCYFLRPSINPECSPVEKNKEMCTFSLRTFLKLVAFSSIIFM